MIAGVICIIVVAILIIAASVDWYSSYCTMPLKTSSHFIFTVMRSEHYQTHFTDGKTGDKELSDTLRGHKSEYSNLGLNLKDLILIINCWFSHYLFSPVSLVKEAIRSNTHLHLLPSTAHLLPLQAVSLPNFNTCLPL